MKELLLIPSIPKMKDNKNSIKPNRLNTIIIMKGNDHLPSSSMIFMKTVTSALTKILIVPKMNDTLPKSFRILSTTSSVNI